MARRRRMSDRVTNAALTRRLLIKLSLAAPAAAVFPGPLHSPSTAAAILADPAGVGGPNFNDVLGSSHLNKAAPAETIAYQVTLPFDVLPHDPQLRVRWTVRRID